MRGPHTSTRRGTRVRIVLKDGRVIVDKFIEKKGRFIQLKNETIRTGDVKSFSIYRHGPNTDPLDSLQ